MRSITHQQGHAALLFAMTIPPLFGLFVLATDGVVALQSKSRLDDATESAALALTAQDSTDNAKNEALAKDYIASYMGSSSAVKNMKITRLECDQIPECKKGVSKGEQRYIQFKISTEYDHSTFFPNSDLVGDKLTVASKSKSEKFEGDAIDLVYVADFSGSMNYKPRKNGQITSNKKKVQILKEIIKEVNVKLEEFNKSGNKKYKNTVSIVPFSVVTKSKINGSNRYCNINQLMTKKNTVNWARIYDHEIDYSATVASVMKEKSSYHCTGKSDWSTNLEIEPTFDFKNLTSKVQQYKASSGTASYQGIIRGAQLLKNGKNPRRLIVVLSDGFDSNSANIKNKKVHEKLVTMGYCDKIRESLSKGKTADNQKITAKISVIGFAYDTKSNPALIQCAGKKNVHEASNKEEIKSKILDLIAEEIGHIR